ncbi:MAG TPA: IS30 family transposase [Dyella sp.]|nr:IS30 family transposase [Dyella sp.]HET6554313.1 IS30 family transposase [Dyella sp.]
MGRPGLSDSQKKELWRRWKDGQTLSEIGVALCRQAGSIHGVLSLRGGIAPIDRRRSALTLTLTEREEISRGLAAGQSIRSMAAALGRSPSTVSREIARNGGAQRYRASDADEAAWKRALRPKQCRLALLPRLRQVVAARLAERWSPDQIAGWLVEEFPDDMAMRVSHETIYRSLFVQARGVLEKELVSYLRSRRMMRRAKASTTKGQPRGRIIDAISIRDRPPEVDDRTIPGHWEGDLLSGAKNSHIATLVERQSRFTVLVKLPGKDTSSVVTALRRHMRKLPAALRKTLTWDRGGELASHKELTAATGVQVYFCDPQSPWQRGTNENTNRLLRQYFPDGTNLSGFSQADLNQIARRLNQRPRKTLGYQTPMKWFNNAVASTS